MDPHNFGNLDPHQIKIRIRIRIKVISWIRCRFRIRINLQMTRQNVWNMSLFEHFFKGLSLYLEARIWIRIRIRVKSRIPDPHQRDADPQHLLGGGGVGQRAYLLPAARRQSCWPLGPGGGSSVWYRCWLGCLEIEEEYPLIGPASGPPNARPLRCRYAGVRSRWESKTTCHIRMMWWTKQEN